MIKKTLIVLGLLTHSYCHAHPDTTSNEPVMTSSSRPDDVVSESTEKMYKLNYAADLPVVAVGVGWCGYAFGKIYDKPNSSVDDIRQLDKSKLNSLDRWAAGKYSDKASATSDLFFYGSMPLPALLLIDKKIRRDAPKIGFLYLEAMSVTGLLYTGCDYFIDRYRPEAYRTDIGPENLTSGNNRNSFFAGHVALVGTSTFFIAKVYHDYHPGTTWSYVLWGGAIAATGATIYLRHAAGKHFPTDLAVGTAIGVLSGVMIPQLHKNKVFKKHGLGFSPAIMPNASYGFTMQYRF